MSMGALDCSVDVVANVFALAVIEGISAFVEVRWDPQTTGL